MKLERVVVDHKRIVRRGLPLAGWHSMGLLGQSWAWLSAGSTACGCCEVGDRGDAREEGEVAGLGESGEGGGGRVRRGGCDLPMGAEWRVRGITSFDSVVGTDLHRPTGEPCRQGVW